MNKGTGEDRNKNWLTNDLWRAHVSWTTFDWIGKTEDGRKSYSAEEWINKIQQAQYNVLIFYTKWHDGFCTFPSKYCSIQPERDYFGECVEEARKRGMKVMAYYSSILDFRLAHEHEDFQVRRRDGKAPEGWYSRVFPEAFCCLNNPQYRQLVLDQIAEILAYKPAAIWADILFPLVEHNCFCKHCQKKYREESGGKDLYDTTDNKWYEECCVEYMKEIKAMVRKSDPECVVTYNTGPRVREMDEVVDFVSHEGNSAAYNSIFARSMRSLGKPFEVTYRMYSAVHSWTMKSYENILLESATIVAHNGACSIELHPTHTGRIMDDGIEVLAEVGKYIREREEYLVGTTPEYDACCLIPDISYGEAKGWDSVFFERDVPAAFGYAGADLSKYRLVVCDGQFKIDDKTAGALADYVRNGGNLILEGPPGAGGGEARKIMEEVLGVKITERSQTLVHYLTGIDPALTENLGRNPLLVEGETVDFEVRGACKLASYTYSVAEKGGLGKFDWNNFPPAIKPTEDAAVSVNAYGKGRAVYVGCPLVSSEIPSHKALDKIDRRVYALQFVSNLVRFLLDEPLLKPTTPAGVEVVINAQKGRHIVHLLNRYGEGEFFESRRDLLKLADIRVCLNEKRIGRVKNAFRLGPAAEKIKMETSRSDGWLSLDIPVLGVHEMILLEHEA